MQFREIIGQDAVKNRLINTVREGRISHAQLFLGKNGYGTLPLAIAYAQYISCSNKNEQDSCGECPSCLKMGKLAHPDLHFSFPVNTNKEVKSKPVSDNFISSWREINQERPYFDINHWHEKIDIAQKQSLINVQESQEIIKKLNFKPYESEFKFLVLWHAELVNTQASNKLLKLIEEPTDKTIILLIAEEEEQLLKTITSRTQLVRIPPIALEDISSFLQQKGLEESAANQQAALAEGNLITALSRLESSEDEEQFFDLFKLWMRACYEANIEKIYAWVEDVSARSFGRERQKRFLEYALEMIREGMIRNYVGPELQRLDKTEGAFLKNFAPFVHENNLIAISEVLSTAHQHISRNGYAKIIFMDMSMKFANLLRVKKRTFVS